MENSNKMNWQDVDIAIWGAIPGSYFSENEEIEQEDVGNVGPIKIGPWQAKCLLTYLREIEDNVGTPVVYYSHLIRNVKDPFIFSTMATCITVKPEEYFYRTESQSEIGYSNVCIMEMNVEQFVSQEIDNLRRLTKPLEALQEVYQECSEPNWDGYEANPISNEAYLEARKLLSLMPSFFPMPDILPEPGGEIGFEWYKEMGFSYVISVRGKNIITYAGRFGRDNETYGTEYFVDSVPKIILDGLKRLFPTNE